MPKYWGKQIFEPGRFPEVGQKQKMEKKKRKRLNDGNNNGQARHGARMAHAWRTHGARMAHAWLTHGARMAHAWLTQAAWTKKTKHLLSL